MGSEQHGMMASSVRARGGVENEMRRWVGLGTMYPNLPPSTGVRVSEEEHRMKQTIDEIERGSMEETLLSRVRLGKTDVFGDD